VTRLKWKRVSVRLEIVLILTQDRCTFAPKAAQDHKSFWTHPMELLGDVSHVESCLVLLQTVLVSVQDRSTVCADRTIGSGIVLDAPDGTTR
jgi:hypothetical protein